MIFKYANFEFFMEEKATDIGAALFIEYHLDNPCGNECRENYLRLAKTAIERFENPFAKKLLEGKIKQYTINIK
jgi:hypothetical protein